MHFSSPMRPTCVTHLLVLDLINLVITYWATRNYVIVPVLLFSLQGPRSSSAFYSCTPSHHHKIFLSVLFLYTLPSLQDLPQRFILVHPPIITRSSSAFYSCTPSHHHKIFLSVLFMYTLPSSQDLPQRFILVHPPIITRSSSAFYSCTPSHHHKIFLSVLFMYTLPSSQNRLISKLLSSLLGFPSDFPTKILHASVFPVRVTCKPHIQTALILLS
jgi:hypothetical protein